jgi:hypothetical protein
VKIVRDGLEEHRIVRRANAILLLDKGWSYADVAEARRRGARPVGR